MKFLQKSMFLLEFLRRLFWDFLRISFFQQSFRKSFWDKSRSLSRIPLLGFLQESVLRFMEEFRYRCQQQCLEFLQDFRLGFIQKFFLILQDFLLGIFQDFHLKILLLGALMEFFPEIFQNFFFGNPPAIASSRSSSCEYRSSNRSLIFPKFFLWVLQEFLVVILRSSS